MTTVIIDYDSGNLRSAEKSFQRASTEVGGGPITSVPTPPICAARAVSSYRGWARTRIAAEAWMPYRAWLRR